jgi:6-phosphogluconolactonase
MTLFVHRDFDALCDALVPRIVQVVRSGTSKHGAASLALAGGSTPFPLYSRLAKQDLDWSKLTLVPGDERWVAPEHEASNLRAIRAAFAGVNPRFGPLVPDQPGAEPSLDAAMATLVTTPQPFDVCVLGMGSDGHFASLFPGATELCTALDPACDEPLVIVTPNPMPEDAPYPRVSLTLSVILASRYPVLVLRGERKREVLEAARGADPRRFPIAALLASSAPTLDIHWSP